MPRILRTLLFLACALLLSAQPTLHAQTWTDTSAYNAGNDAWLLEVTSMDPHKLSCTFIVDYWNGGQHVHGPIGIVLPSYAGFGAAIVGHTWGPSHVANFQHQTLCSPMAGAAADVQPHPAPAAPPFNPACMAGDWKEQYQNPFTWHFSVDGDIVTIERADHFVKGILARSGNTWSGQLLWNDPQHTVTSNFTLSPTLDCTRVNTNKSWWYHR